MGLSSLVLVADHQSTGRGQRGRLWESQAGENLLCSWLIEGGGVAASSAFLLNMAVACALCETGVRWLGANSRIKWPNDLLYGGVGVNEQAEGAGCHSAGPEGKNSNDRTCEGEEMGGNREMQADPDKDLVNGCNGFVDMNPPTATRGVHQQWKKWGGILIENQLSGGVLRQIIIGFGLNINQSEFGAHLPRAGSLKAVVGRDIDRLEVLQHALNQIQMRLGQVRSGQEQRIKESYLQNLWGTDEWGDFLLDGIRVRARIEDVDVRSGELILSDGDRTLRGAHPGLRHCYPASGAEMGDSGYDTTPRPQHFIL